MLLVACEYCRSKGYLVAYHEVCLLSAMDGKQIKPSKRNRCGGDLHPLKPLIEGLISQRESDDVPVMIPPEYEACYFCGVFRKKGRYYIYVYIDSDVRDLVRTRREKFNTDPLGEVKIGDKVIFPHDAKFEDFYKGQPKF